MASLNALNDMHTIFQQPESQKDCEIVVTDKDKGILRELGKNMAEIAALPIQHQRKAMWARMNRLQEAKSMVWMTDICWNEMNETEHRKSSSLSGRSDHEGYQYCAL